MHKNTINYIVDTTLRDMNIDNTASFKILIKMTFLMESGLQSTMNESKSKLGFMGIDRVQFAQLVKEYIVPRKTIREKIEDVSLVDLKADSIDDLIEACIYNIAFQVAITWAAYLARFDSAPDVHPQAAAEKYLNFWANEYSSDHRIQQCVTLYQNTFNRQ